MIKGIYTSASAMLPRIKQQELTANNLSNASTPGFKKDRIFTRELSKAEQKQKIKHNQTDWQQPMIDHVYTSFAPGVFDRTGNPLNMAIEGDGFFKVQLPDGTTALTRNGAFQVNSDGNIEIPGGALLMGEGGPIYVGTGKVEISTTGIVQSNGATVGQITPVTVPDVTQLQKAGGSLFLVEEGTELLPVDKASVQQGYLEASNVDIVREMIEMIISFRNYEADSKSVQSQDQTLEHLFNRVASK